MAFNWGTQYASGSALDDYEFIRNIGSGGFGQASLCRYKEDNRQYVIKKIDITRSSGRQSADTELEHLSRLRNKYIVGYMDSFICGDSQYIVMEYCESGDLAGFIKRQANVRTLMAESQVTKWTLQMTLGLDFIHNEDVIHRDLKPQNIFLTKRGNIKIGDFGIARDLTEEMRAYTQIGTVFYMSPEMWRNERYDFRTDVWSLGCIVYELMALQPAVNLQSVTSVPWKIDPIRQGPYSQPLIEFTGTLLTFDKQRRPTVGQLLQKPFIQRAKSSVDAEATKNLIAVRINTGAASKTLLCDENWTVSELYNKMTTERIVSPGSSFEMFTTDGRPIKNKEFRNKRKQQNIPETTYVEEFDLAPNSTITLQQKVVGG